MSGNELTVVAALTRVALAFDGLVLGIALGYIARRSIDKFRLTSAALRKINDAPSLGVSDLRSVLSPSPSDSSDSSKEGGKLVIVRGVVEAKSAVDVSWKSSRPDVLVSHKSGERGVVLQRTQTCIYNEWRGIFGWASDLRYFFGRSWKENDGTPLRMVPFVLVEGGRWPQSDYLIVNMDGSGHPLPLVTVYHRLQPISATPYTFLQALFGHEYPVGLLDEEKILPLGKDISAVGICCLKDGIIEIRSCKDLPYFLSDMTKDHMVADLEFRTEVLYWSGIVLSLFSIGVLGYAAVRNWMKLKELPQSRPRQQNFPASDDADSSVVGEEETGDVPDGELCVICLMRRRRSAFIPCGHLVCCQHCALSVERDLTSKCPVCRQAISSSVRIFDS